MTSAATPDVWKALPMNFRQFFRASWTKRPRADGGARQAHGQRPKARPDPSDVGNKRHTFRGCDAGAPHRLHGDGAAAYRGRPRRSAEDESTAAVARSRAAVGERAPRWPNLSSESAG